jgi:hypothetical protein
MPFDYESLKQLSNSALVNSTLVGSDFATDAVANAELAPNTITATQLGSGSVDFGSSVVSGTTPFSKGGTGSTSTGGAYNLLATNSSNNSIEFRPTGIYRMVVFTGNGTWSKGDSRVRYIWIQVQAGAGGASGHGESGAAGGYAERLLNVDSINNVGITVGGGGSGTYYNNAGGNGNGSSFGPYVSAGGGHGANRHNNHNGGLSGVGSGGDFNIHTGSGGGHEQRSSGMGGASFWGGPAPAGHPQGGHFSHNHQGHSAPGTGGTAGYFHGHRGSDGRPGIVVITEFF